MQPFSTEYYLENSRFQLGHRKYHDGGWPGATTSWLLGTKAILMSDPGETRIEQEQCLDQNHPVSV